MYEYDWAYGKARLNWIAPTVALIRVHEDIKQIPGPYSYVMVAVVEDSLYELMGALGKFPDTDEVREFYKYMKSLGLKKTYRRFKGKENASDTIVL